MLHIHNIRKIENRKVFGGWVIKGINLHPTQRKYMFDVHCLGPVGTTIDRCTISLERDGKMIKTMTHPTTHSYFFFYNGNITNVCGGREWLSDIGNFISQLEYIIKKYHNKG